ncbi:hypothetical protein [Arthrobacter sp.]|uniref:hypothetical protein n=1 Tax=Arthrobacter sp. TaxID=1667 RepID=UPI0028114800|nr:hypothetical protein [Arthrobacter sp.]
MSDYRLKSIALKVATRSAMDNELNEAVQFLATKATSSRSGIRVTRNGPGDFTVSLDPSVPFGTTLEDDSW